MNHRGFETWNFGKFEYPYKDTLYDMCKTLVPSLSGYKTLLLDIPVRFMEDERTFAVFKSDPAAVNMITLVHLFVHLHTAVCKQDAPNIVGWLQRTPTKDNKATYSWMLVWVVTAEAVDDMHRELANLFMFAEYRSRKRPLPKMPPPKSSHLMDLTIGRYIELIAWYTNTERAVFEATADEETATVQTSISAVREAKDPVILLYRLPRAMALDKAFSPATLYQSVRNDPTRRGLACEPYYDVARYSVSPADGGHMGFRDPNNAWFIATRRWTDTLLQTYLPTDDESINAARVHRLAHDIGEKNTDAAKRQARLMGAPAADRDAIVDYVGNNVYTKFQVSYLVHGPEIDAALGRIYHETLALGDVAGLRTRLTEWKKNRGLAIFEHCWNTIIPTAPKADRAVMKYLHDYAESQRYVNWLNEHRGEEEQDGAQRQRQARSVGSAPQQPKELVLAAYDHVRAHFTIDRRLSYFANTRAKFFMDLELGPQALVAHSLIHMLLLCSMYASVIMYSNVLYQNALLSGQLSTSKSFALNVLRLCMIDGTYLSVTDFTNKIFSTFKVDLPGMVWIFEEMKAEMLGINSENGKTNDHNQLCTTMKAMLTETTIDYGEAVMEGSDKQKGSDGAGSGPSTEYAGGETTNVADTRRMLFRVIPALLTIIANANRGVENADKPAKSRYNQFQVCNGARADHRSQKKLAMSAAKDEWATNPRTRQLAARMQFVQACMFMFNRQSSFGEKRSLARRPDMTIAHTMFGRATRYLGEMGIALSDGRVTSSLEKYAQMLTVWHAVDMIFCNPALEIFKQAPTPEMILRLEAHVVCTEEIAFFTIGHCMHQFVPPSVRQLQAYLKQWFATPIRRAFPPAVDDKRLRDPNYYVYPFSLRHLLAEAIAFAGDKTVSQPDMACELDLLQTTRELRDSFFLREDTVRAQYDAHAAGAMAEEAIWSTFRDRQHNRDRDVAKIKYLRLFTPTTAAQGGAAGADGQQIAISRFFVENLNFENLVNDTIRACFYKGIRKTRTADSASGPRIVLTGETVPGYPYLLQTLEVTDKDAEDLLIDRRLLNPGAYRAPDETGHFGVDADAVASIKLPAGCDYEELVVMNHLYQLGITPDTEPTYTFLQVPARFEAYWDTVVADAKYDGFRDRSTRPDGTPKRYPEDRKHAAPTAAETMPPPRSRLPDNWRAGLNGEFAPPARTARTIPLPRAEAETTACATGVGLAAFISNWDRGDRRDPDLVNAVALACWKHSGMGRYTIREPDADAPVADGEYAPSEHGAYGVVARADAASVTSRASRHSHTGSMSSAPAAVQISEESIPRGAGVGSIVAGIYGSQDQ